MEYKSHVSIALLHWIRRKKAIFLTIWRKIILLIPLIFILPRILSGSAMGVFLAEPIADTIADLYYSTDVLLLLSEIKIEKNREVY